MTERHPVRDGEALRRHLRADIGGDEEQRHRRLAVHLAGPLPGDVGGEGRHIGSSTIVDDHVVEAASVNRTDVRDERRALVVDAEDVPFVRRNHEQLAVRCEPEARRLACHVGVPANLTRLVDGADGP